MIRSSTYILMLYLSLFLVRLDSEEITAEKFQQCIQELQEELSSYELVSQGLSLYRVSQSQWVAIANTLKARAATLKTKVQERAAKLKPNPLSPFDAKKALEILKSELDLMIEESVSESNLYNTATIRKMSDYLINHSSILQACFTEQKEKTEQKQVSSSPKSLNKE